MTTIARLHVPFWFKSMNAFQSIKCPRAGFCKYLWIHGVWLSGNSSKENAFQSFLDEASKPLQHHCI